MLVRDFKNTFGYIYEDAFLDSLPNTCLDDRCNSPMEISEALTGMHCSNPKCPTKVANRLVAMAQMLGVKDLGAARANTFITTMGINNPLLMFAYEPSVDGVMGQGISMETSQKIVDQFLAKKSFALWEYVRLANLPFIQTSALQIFGDFDDLTEAYNAIEAGGVAYIQDKLSIKAKNSKSSIGSAVAAGVDLDNLSLDVSVRALKIYTSLMTFKSDLFQVLPYVNIIKLNDGEMKVLRAVCSEEVGFPFKTKSDFYATINNLYSDLHVEFLNSVNKSIDYLIWAGADGSNVRVTNKVNKVRGWNAKYEEHKAQGTLKNDEHEIPILTAQQFMLVLQTLESQRKGEI